MEVFVHKAKYTDKESMELVHLGFVIILSVCHFLSLFVLKNR